MLHHLIDSKCAPKYFWFFIGMKILGSITWYTSHIKRSSFPIWFQQHTPRMRIRAVSPMGCEINCCRNSYASGQINDIRSLITTISCLIFQQNICLRRHISFQANPFKLSHLVEYLQRFRDCASILKESFLFFHFTNRFQ